MFCIWISLMKMSLTSPASSHIALEPKADVGADELAVADEDVVHAAVGVAANDEAAMCPVYRTAGDDDVFQCGPVGCPAPLDFMQMPSSPAFTVQWNRTTFLQALMSMPSPFWAHQSLKIRVWSMVRSEQ